MSVHFDQHSTAPGVPRGRGEHNLSFLSEINWQWSERDMKDALKMIMWSIFAGPQRPGTSNGDIRRKLGLTGERAREICRRIACSPETPPVVLAHLAGNMCSQLLERIADNPRTDSATLRELAGHPCADVRAAVGENPNTPRPVLEALIADENPDVRFRIAECPHLDQDLLVQLSEDSNPYVAFRAQATRLRAGVPRMRHAHAG